METTILDRIKKLVNKAESAKSVGSIKEAEIFMAKVEEMLNKYQLSMDSVQNHELQQSIDIVESGFKDGIEFGRIKTDGTWERGLFTSIARHYRCDVIYVRRYECNNKNYIGRANIIGTRENIEAVKFIYDYIHNILHKQSRITYNKELNDVKCQFSASGKLNKDRALAHISSLVSSINAIEADNILYYSDADKILARSKKCNGNWILKEPCRFGLIKYRESWLKSYLKGAVNGISRKLAEIRRSRTDEQAGLVLVHEKRIETYLEKFHPNVSESKCSTVVADSIYMRGYDYGKDVSIAKGVTNSGTVMKSLNI